MKTAYFSMVRKMYKIYNSKSGRRYLYDSVSNNFFEVDDESYLMLPEKEGETELLKCFGEEFWQMVYGIDPLPVPNVLPVVTTADEEPEILVLELTQQCNFRCEYCIYSGHYKYEREHRNVNMSYETIDKVVDVYFGREKVPDYVSLYGGEPLLQFDLIKYLVNKIEEKGYFPEYAMTTNGSLILKQEIAEFIVSKKVRLTVSFDGLNNDLYRKTRKEARTSETVFEALELLKDIDEDYFKEYVSLSITLAPPYQLKENADFFNSHELLSQLKLLVNTVNDRDSDFFESFNLEKERKQLSDDYKRLAEEFIEMDDLEMPFHHALFGDAMLRIEDRMMAIQEDAFPPGPCIPGKNRLFITATGEKYMCERVGNYGNLGNLYEDKKQIENYHKVLTDFRDNVTDFCEKCIFVRICDACFSIFREGDKMSNKQRICQICEEKKKWFDFMIYVFLSKKEREEMRNE